MSLVTSGETYALLSSKTLLKRIVKQINQIEMISRQDPANEKFEIRMNFSFEYGKTRFNLLPSPISILDPEDIEKALESSRVNFNVFKRQGIIKSIEEGGKMILDFTLLKSFKLKRGVQEEKQILIVEEKIHEKMTFNDFISLIKGRSLKLIS
jgi:hypothetical protein